MKKKFLLLPVSKLLIALVFLALIVSSCRVTYRERRPPPPREKVIIVH